MTRFATGMALAIALGAIAPPALAVVRSDREAVSLVRKKLDATPELRARLQALGKTPFVLYVEAKPGETDGFYHLYAGENHPDHTVRLWSLLVNPKTDEVRAYDPLTDGTLDWKAFTAAVRRHAM